MINRMILQTRQVVLVPPGPDESGSGAGGSPAPPSSNRYFQLWRALTLAGIVLALTPGALGAANFTATLDADTVAVGETVTLTLRFEGGQPRSIPSLPDIPNLQVVPGSTEHSIILVNGQTSVAFSQTFSLTPTQPGEYRIPALTAEINGQTCASQPVALKVVKPGAAASVPAGDQLAFFKLIVPKKEIYLGEVFQVEFRVYVREGVANAENILESFDRYGGCPLKAEGFSVLKTAHMQHRQARSGNVAYYVATLVTALTPVKTGPLTLGSMDVPLTLQLPSGNRRPDRFDPFGMFQQFEEKHVSLTADPESLTALALPKDNVPSNFNGAVGNYTLTVSAGPTNVTVGDPVTVKIQISGHGALDALALPAQTAWRDFKTYPPTTKVDTTDALGLDGTKTFEQVVVPQSAEITALPAVSFSFFDSDRKSYRTLSQAAVPLLVKPGASAAAPTVAATSHPAQDNAPQSQDIVDIKQRMGTLAQLGPPLVQQPWFLALQGVPVLAWLSAVIWRRRAENLANNPHLRRQRQVAQLVRDGQEELRRLAADNKSEEFFATLFHLLQEQLGERLDLPASAITEAVLQEHLRPRGAPETILTPLQELFQTCNLVRYAPIKTSQELAAIIPKFEGVMRELRQLKL